MAVGGRSVALCLALNANSAKEVYEDHGGNGSEYGDWTEVTDGTNKTLQEKLTDAKSRAWNSGPDISGPASRFVKSKWKEGISTLGSLSSYWNGNGVSNTAPVAQQPVGGSKSEMDESSLRDNPGDKVQEGSTETMVVSQSDASGSGQNQHGVAKKKKRREIDNLGDTSCKVYVGTRLHQGLSEKSWFLQRTRNNGLETQIRMYRCKNKSEVTVSVITEEIRCMYQKLGQQETQTNYAEYRYGGKTTTMDKVEKETNKPYTMMYTTKDWNAIIKPTDDEVADGTTIKAEETGDVKIAEVRVTTATKGKRIDKKTNNRLICYTTECLNSSRFKSLKIQGKSKEELNHDERSRLLLLCLLIYTGWGLYTGSNETTKVSCDDIDDGETTVSVTQGENSRLLFDTNTEFTFTGTGGSSVEAVEAERREEGATGAERSEGAKSAHKTDKSQTVSSVGKEAAQAAFTMKLRSAGKQHTESSEANPPKAANKTVETAKAGDAGGPLTRGAAKKAPDTSSSSSSDEATEKVPRRSERLAKKNNGNKSK